MKKYILIVISFCFLNVLHAQILKPKNTSNNNQQTQSSSYSLTDADYFLAVAKMTVKTGKDNKELNSKVILCVYPASGTDNWRKGYNQESITTEFKPWSSILIFLNGSCIVKQPPILIH